MYFENHSVEEQIMREIIEEETQRQINSICRKRILHISPTPSSFYKNDDEEIDIEIRTYVEEQNIYFYKTKIFSEYCKKIAEIVDCHSYYVRENLRGKVLKEESLITINDLTFKNECDVCNYFDILYINVMILVLKKNLTFFEAVNELTDGKIVSFSGGIWNMKLDREAMDIDFENFDNYTEDEVLKKNISIMYLPIHTYTALVKELGIHATLEELVNYEHSHLFGINSIEGITVTSYKEIIRRLKKLRLL